MKENSTGKVYFVCRSEYESPVGHRIVELPGDSVLGWFQQEWPDAEMRDQILSPDQTGAFVADDGSSSPIPTYNYDAIEEHIATTLGGTVYDMLSIWKAMAKWGPEPPKTKADFEKFVASIDYDGDPIAFHEHGLQTVTDDGTIEIAWYLFDDAFIREFPERTAYLTHKDWQLPSTFESSGRDVTLKNAAWNPEDLDANAEGLTYCVFICGHDRSTIRDISGTWLFSGIRIPELANHFRQTPLPLDEGGWPRWPPEILLTRALIQTSKANTLGDFVKEVANSSTRSELWTMAPVVSSLIHKNPRFLAGHAEQSEADLSELMGYLEPNPDPVWTHSLQPLLTQASPHMCQVRFCNQIGYTDIAEPAFDLLSSFIFFDDLWIAANPQLAESILRYATRGGEVLIDLRGE